jgi:hypothetical protein
MRQQDNDLPKYVRLEFEAYLKCGRLEYGFLRIRCEESLALGYQKKGWQ